MVGVSYFGDLDLVNPVIVSPDAGGVYRCALAFALQIFKFYFISCIELRSFVKLFLRNMS